MTKTLKELELEHPDWCFRCGHREMSAPFHSCYPAHVINILTAAKREDEKEIEGLSRKLDETFCEAHRQGSDLRDQLTAAQATIAERERDLLVQAGRSDGKNIIIRELEAKLSAEREAHAATKEELWEAQETVQQQAWELREVDQAALAPQSQRAAEASINRPADKQPTDDRGEGEK